MTTELTLRDLNIEVPNEYKAAANKYFTDIFKRLPFNTRRSYESDLKDYYRYCFLNGYPGLSADVRLTENSIKDYVTSMCESQLSYNTVLHRMATITKFLSIAGLPNPLRESEYLRDFVKLELKEHDIYNRAKQAPALRLSDLEYINNNVIPDTLLDIRDLALINMMFDGLLRADEVTSVQINHIDHKKNKLLIPKSKSDQSGKGKFRYISNTTLSYVADYIEEANYDNRKQRPKLKGDPTRISSGILFRATSPKGTSMLPYDESVVRIKNMRRLDYTSVYRALKRIAKKSGLDLPITGHSQRVGAAVTMAEAGIAEKKIQDAGGWTTPVMVSRYTEQADVEGGMSEISNTFKR